jgi:hypothetical protein
MYKYLMYITGIHDDFIRTEYARSLFFSLLQYSLVTQWSHFITVLDSFLAYKRSLDASFLVSG